MKKPWNLINSPVYSVCTEHDGQLNMNICTYVSAVSMNPKQYLVALDYNTLTHKRVKEQGEFVLQLLSEKQATSVRNLGQKSGKSFDKNGFLMRKQKTSDENYILQEWHNYRVLTHCVCTLKLQVVNSMDAADHEMFLCNVLAYKVWNTESPLTVDILRDQKIVRM
jgi:flavin reductase (DIM6/NTAB) family NADH-FMN oxidoreductase RutF